jgi:hypothetical protein
VPVDQMRRRPIGTGPFKLVEFKMNESIKLVRNPDYWKKGLPYLDGIEFTIIPDRSTRMLSFIAGKFDMTFPSDVTVPLLKNIKAGAPNALCTMRETGVSANLIVNRDAPPFDNPKIRRAMGLTIDRKAFIDILAEGEGRPSGIMLPPPDGVWGMPEEMLKGVPGYGDVDKAREEARALMKEAGYGPDKRLKVKVSTRNIATFRDPAVILIDQLKEIYFTSMPLSSRSRPPTGSPRSTARTIRSRSTAPRAGSTTPTSNFTKTTAAVRRATTPATAIPSWKSCSTGNRPRRTPTSAKSWYGRLNASSRRTAPARSSSITVSLIAGNRGSRAGR